jgi:hypothetical protein
MKRPIKLEEFIGWIVDEAQNLMFGNIALGTIRISYVIELWKISMLLLVLITGLLDSGLYEGLKMCVKLCLKKKLPIFLL